MKRAAYLLCVIGFVSVLSQFGKTLLGMGGIPNVIPVIRDLLMLALALLAISRINFFQSADFFIPAIICLLLVLLNIFVALFDGRLFAGVYYGRLYSLPLIYAVAVYGLILTLEKIAVRQLARLVYVSGAMMAGLAIAIFASIEYNPALLHTLMGGEGGTLATAWYIAGGVWLRMGLPATSPNSLGLLLGLYWLFLLALLWSGLANEICGRSFQVVFAVTLAVILMTFSRSSWLACFFGGVALFAATWKEWKLGHLLRPMRLLGIAVVGGCFGVLLVFLVDAYSNGAVTRWIELNYSGTDPSMVGHKQTFALAWSLLDEYFMLGFPRGTVGPKAALFGGGLNNVENSVLGIFYDMGVPIGLAFMLCICLVLRAMWRHPSQASVLVGFLVAAQFLPYAFEADVIIFFLMLYALLGRLMACERSNSAIAQVTTKRFKPLVASGCSV